MGRSTKVCEEKHTRRKLWENIMTDKKRKRWMWLSRNKQYKGEALDRHPTGTDTLHHQLSFTVKADSSLH